MTPYTERFELDAIYLSPHLDDVVLSCGAQLARMVALGQRILVVTAMAGEPPAPPQAIARQLHQAWGLGDDEVVAARRREDIAACAELGVEALHLDIPDALYRRHPSSGESLYKTFKNLFKKPHTADAGLVEALTRRFAALPSAPRVVAPLGVGGHVDHQLVRCAAERAAPGRLELYEDFPYARKWLARWRVLGFPCPFEMRLFEPEAEDFDAKCQAVACYRSQIGTLFGNVDALRNAVWGFAARRGGERVWWDPRQAG